MRIFIRFFALLGFLISLQIQAQAKNKVFIVPTAPINWSQNISGIKLSYYGGPIISQVKVVSVNWGANVASLFVNEMPQFYTDFVAGNRLDWLSEYNTDIKAVNGQNGTQQKFSRGSFLTAVTIDPQNKKLKLTDEEIQTELAAQIAQNILPRPDQDTLYMIHFPNKVSISIEGMSSCQSFGGYHFNSNHPQFGQIYYSVLPDCSADSEGYEKRLARMTFVASHELMEAITDPQPTVGSHPEYPQAWNVDDGNEISDVCAWGAVQMKGLKRSYSVTKNWSNSRNTCYDGN